MSQNISFIIQGLEELAFLISLAAVVSLPVFLCQFAPMQQLLPLQIAISMNKSYNLTPSHIESKDIT